LTVTFYLIGRIAQNLLHRERPWANGVIPFIVAGLAAAAVAFALFYRFPARDLLAGRKAPAPVEQEATNTQITPPRHTYITGGATPDYRNGLPAVITPHLSVALAREVWEQSFAFYRVWPVAACIAGCALLFFRAKDLGRRTEGDRSGLVLSPQSFVLTLSVWMLVAAIMLVVGIVARLYVRYPLYALPAVSLGSGVSLAWLVRRGRWGTVIAVGLLTVSAVSLAFFWYSRIVYDWKLPV
jgi:hypothetical protein